MPHQRIIAGPALQKVVAIDAFEPVGICVTGDLILEVRPDHILDVLDRVVDGLVLPDPALLEIGLDADTGGTAVGEAVIPDGVETAAAVDDIIGCAQVLKDGVIARAAVHDVGAAGHAVPGAVAVEAADQNVVALAAVQGVVARIADERVVAVPASDDVVTFRAVEPVRAAVAGDLVVEVRADEVLEPLDRVEDAVIETGMLVDLALAEVGDDAALRIGPQGRMHVIGEGAIAQRIIAGSALDVVVVPGQVGEDPIVPGAAKNHFRAALDAMPGPGTSDARDDHVVALFAHEVVVARAALEVIIAIAVCDEVVAIGADEPIVLGRSEKGFLTHVHILVKNGL